MIDMETRFSAVTDGAVVDATGNLLNAEEVDVHSEEREMMRPAVLKKMAGPTCR
jgi:hypothetical protein